MGGRVDEGEVDAAAIRFTRARELEPDGAFPLNNLCYVELRRSRPDAALPLCRLALERDPASQVVRNNLVLALARVGAFDEARAVSLAGADLRGCKFQSCDLEDGDLSEADLKSAILVSTDLSHAKLNSAQVYGIAAWEVTLEGAEQRDLLVTRPDQPRITTDDLEVAQFIYVLLNHRKLRDVFNTTTQRSVLILGRFGGGGLDVLRAVADSLRQQGLIPIIFDFERPRQRNYTETVITLAGLCSFVIVDLSGPSVPQELQAIIAATLRMPLVPIVEEGRNPAAMLVDFQELDYFLGPPIRFNSISALVAQIPERAIAPAQAWLAQRRNRLKTIDGG